MGKFRITPAVRLSIGLVILTLSILILAQALGLAPGTERQQLKVRQLLAETLAVQTIMAIKRGDMLLLQAMLENVIERNPDVRSIGIRRNDQGVVAQTAQHEEFWDDASAENSTPTHIRLPLLINGEKRGNFEITFHPLTHEDSPFLGLPSFVLLIIFVSVTGFVGFWLYIKRALHHLDPSAVVPARVRNALNILAEGVLILDKREQIVLVNHSLAEKLQRDEKSLIGRKASSLGWQQDESDSAAALPWLQALSSGQKQVGVRLELKTHEQEKQIFRVNAVPILDDKGNSQGTIASFDDISELEAKNHQLEDMVKALAATQLSIENKNRELKYLASRDPVTDCYNRRSLFDYLAASFDKARSSHAEYACIMTDIDHFKRVNDTHGHGVGDEVIKMVANTIREVIREGDILARFGGEEFCIILPGAPISQANLIANRCREKIAAQLCQGIKVTSSFGISSVRLGAQTPNELIHQADEALYHSKEQGRNCVSNWQPNMRIANKTADNQQAF